MLVQPGRKTREMRRVSSLVRYLRTPKATKEDMWKNQLVIMICYIHKIFYAFIMRRGEGCFYYFVSEDRVKLLNF